MQTNEELIVYKFDKFHSSEGVTFYRVKLHKGKTVRFINTNKGTISEVKLPDDTTLGWVFETELKKIKQKK